MIQIKPSHDPLLIAHLNRGVQALHAELYPTHFKPYYKASVTEAFIQMFQQEQLYAYVAWGDDLAIGYILLVVHERKENAFQYSSKALYIDQIYVDKNQQKKGIGQQLVAQAKLKAQELDIPSLQLDHWTLNEQARHFFQKCGFTYYREHMFLNI